MQSREYKYNRQAFDQKARSMTEKYAKAGARRNSSGSQSIQTNSNTSMVLVCSSLNCLSFCHPPPLTKFEDPYSFFICKSLVADGIENS